MKKSNVCLQFSVRGIGAESWGLLLVSLKSLHTLFQYSQDKERIVSVCV